MSVTGTVPYPLVSLVMAIRNEAPFIRATLESVAAQDYPADRWEVIIADGSSTDGTPERVREFASKHPNVRLLDNPRRTTATGLNAAIAASRGDVIVRMDGHSELPSGYVRICVEELQRTGAEHVGGAVSTVSPSPFGEVVALAMSTPFGVGGARFRYSDREEWVDTVFLGAWRRDVFERIGLFDESMACNEDDEFNYRLREAGGRNFMSPPLRVTYRPRDTAWGLAKQYARYGFWKVRVMQKHPRQMRPSHFVPPAFAMALLVSSLSAPFSAFGQLLFALTAGSYLVASLVATLVCGRKHALSLPLVYAILHVSYGFGFLSGLVVFAGSWRDRGGRVPFLSRRQDGSMGFNA